MTKLFIANIRAAEGPRPLVTVRAAAAQIPTREETTVTAISFLRKRQT